MYKNLYRLLTWAAAPLVPFILARRRLKGKETSELKRIKERFGFASIPRPEGRIFWFNAASVGESNSIMPVVGQILERYPDAHALITTTTLNGALNMEKKLAGLRAFHQFLPVDRGAYARRFLDYWKPSVGFFVDSDFWPNLIMKAKRRSIPLILLNGRLSAKSHARWMKLRSFARELMSAFIYSFAKSDDNLKRLSDMGLSPVNVGDLKYGVAPLPADPKKLAEFKKMAGARHVWVAASTHEGEEELLSASHRIVKLAFPDALMVIAPRNPARGPAIAKMLKTRKQKVALRSKGEKITKTIDVYIADTLGELGVFYRVAPIAFVGNSLFEKNLSGHNGIEPAQLGAAVLSGKYHNDVAETYELLKKDNAVIIVDNENDLGNRVSELFANPEMLSGFRGRAKAAAERETSVLDRVMERLEPVLDSVK